jgi:hypothetical protein
MVVIIHSIPDECVECGATNLTGHQMLIFGECNTIFCNACGIAMVYQEEDEEEEEEGYSEIEVSASFASCPHCHTIDEIKVEGGAEWCGACGLDPNIKDYPSDELAHLWKEDSGIRHAMGTRSIPKVGSRMYQFLVNNCGPHCCYEEACPQSARNFATCFGEEHDLGGPNLLHIGEENVGRGKRKKSRKAREKERKRILKEKSRAVLACAGSGWYREKYCNETQDPNKPDDTGGGSGT